MSRSFKLPEDYIITNPNIINHVKKSAESGIFAYLFLGAVGVGKTYLGQLIINHASAGYGATRKKITARNLYNEYLGLMRDKPSDLKEALRKRQGWLKCRDGAAMLDDLGTEPVSASNASTEFMCGLIEDYYGWNDRNKALVITTNLTGNELLERYGARVMDRLADMLTVCEFTGSSFRNSRKISG